MKLFLLDSVPGAARGHFLDFDLRLGRALLALGHQVEVFVYAALDDVVLAAFTAAGLSVHRHFRRSADLAGDTVENFHRLCQTTATDLASLPDSQGWIWPSLSAHQFAATVAAGRGVPMAGGLVWPPGYESAYFPMGWASTARSLLERPDRVLLGAYYDVVLRSYPPPVQAQRFPCPHDAAAPIRPRRALRRLGFLGVQRAEKGAALLPSVISALLDRGYELTLQDSTGKGGGCPSHSRLRMVGLVQDFAALVEEHDLVIWPARFEAYQNRPSAVISQAIASGVPVVVPSNCAPAEGIVLTGSGTFFHRWAADAIVEAVDEAAHRYAELVEAAGRSAELWQHQEGTERLAQTLAAWFQAPLPVHLVKPAETRVDLDLLEQDLVGFSYRDPSTDARGRVFPFNPAARLLGRDVPAEALTGVGLARLRNVRTRVEAALWDGVPGDVLEAGVGRGGVTIMMRGVLAAHGVRDRRVWAADTFRAVGMEVVQSNFARHGLLDDQVLFLPGPLSDRLLDPRIERLAVLRINAPTHGSTRDALNLLYDRVSPGGYVIVDGYGGLPPCRSAVDEFRRRAWVSAPLVDVDGTAVYWRKSDPTTAETEPPPPPPRTLAYPRPRSETGPLLTVIIPTFERLQYLHQCLGSVLSQDPGPDIMEILVADDASTVDVAGLVRDLAGDRVRYVRRAENQGQWSNVNQAISDSQGQWVHLLHDDDFVLDGFYRLMGEAAQRVPDSVGVLCCQCRNLFVETAAMQDLDPFGPDAGVLPDWLDTLATRNPVHLPALVVRRRVYETQGLYDETLTCADWEFHIRSALHHDWWYQPENLARYRVHHDSFGRRQRANGNTASNLRRVMDLATGYLPSDVATRVLPRARGLLAGQFLRWAAVAFDQGRCDLAVHLVHEAMTVSPRWG